MTCIRQNVKSDEPQKLCSNQWNKCQWSLRAWDWVGSILLASFKLCFLIVFSWKRFQLSALDQSVSSLCKALFLAERSANRPTPCKAATFVGMWFLAADRQAQTGPQYFFFFLSFPEISSFPKPFKTAVSFPFLWHGQKRHLFALEEQSWVLCLDSLLKEKGLEWSGLPWSAPHRPELADTSTMWGSAG